MSRISDVLIDIRENLDENVTDEQIAEKIGCPVSWVTQEREEMDREEAGFYYEPW
jgi:hypothetical protein